MNSLNKPREIFVKLILRLYGFEKLSFLITLLGFKLIIILFHAFLLLYLPLSYLKKVESALLTSAAKIKLWGKFFRNICLYLPNNTRYSEGHAWLLRIQFMFAL